MIYSAFWDDAHTVKELLKYGCDVQCLDHLIFSEYLGMLKQEDRRDREQISWSEMPLLPGCASSPILPLPALTDRAQWL